MDILYLCKSLFPAVTKLKMTKFHTLLWLKNDTLPRAYDVSSDKQNDLMYLYILQKEIFWVWYIIENYYIIICHDQAETPGEKAISQGILSAIITYVVIESTMY